MVGEISYLEMLGTMEVMRTTVCVSMAPDAEAYLDNVSALSFIALGILDSVNSVKCLMVFFRTSRYLILKGPLVENSLENCNSTS